MSNLLTDVLATLSEPVQEPIEKQAEVALEENTDTRDELIKQAEAEGRAVARGFIAEIEKIAVETHPVAISPDHGQTLGNVNAAMQTSTAGGAVGSAATAVINSLINPAGHNGGAMQTPAGTVGAAETQVAAPPTFAEIARQDNRAEAAAKTAGDFIVEALYNQHIA